MIDAIRNDPEWKGGDYTTQPPSLRTAAQMLWLVGSNPIIRQRRRRRWRRPTRRSTTTSPTTSQTDDANDTLYALESSRDYDPGPALEQITAPLLAINSADDLVNPPELGVLEREITSCPARSRHRDSSQRSNRRARDAHCRGSLATVPRGSAAVDRNTVVVVRPTTTILETCK